MAPLLPEATAAAAAVLMGWAALAGWDRRDWAFVIVVLSCCVVIESAWLAYVRYRLMEMQPVRYRIRRLP